MRCKNCGTENDDNRYICENCGSPLYDEEDIKRAESASASDDATRTFKAVSDNNPYDRIRDDQNAGGSRYNGRHRAQNTENTPARRNDTAKKEKDPSDPAEKKSIAIIVVLAIVLIAIIASVIAIAGNNNRDDSAESTDLTKISTAASTEDTTERRTTTERTTEETTEKTTKTTTTQRMWIINASSSGGGSVSGGGEYANGDKVTLTAKADSGYEFDGWYSSGVKVSSDSKYTFTANENASFSAVFNPVTTEPATETTLPADTTPAGNSTVSDVAFG